MGISGGQIRFKVELEGKGSKDQDLQVSVGNASTKGICTSNAQIQSNCGDGKTFLYFKNLCSSEKRFSQTKGNLGCQKTESKNCLSKIQDDHYFRYQADASSRSLDGLNRFERSILPCSHTSLLPEVPGFFCREADLQVRGDAIWPQCGSPDLYKNHQCYDCDFEAAKHISYCIPRRLAGMGKVKECLREESPSLPRPIKKDGIFDKSKEISNDPYSDNSVLRSHLVFADKHHISTKRDAKEMLFASKKFKSEKVLNKKTVGKFSGVAELCYSGQPLVQTEAESLASVSESPSKFNNERSTDSCSTSAQSQPESLEDSGVQRVNLMEMAKGQSRSFHRCFIHRMGVSYLRRPFRSRDMEQSEECSYQCKRVSSSLPGHQEFNFSERHNNQPFLGQSCGSLSIKERRILQINSNKRVDPSYSSVEEEEESLHQSFPHPGMQECLGRSPIKGSTCADRMGIGPVGFSVLNRQMGHSPGGFVRHKGKQQTQDIRITIPRSPGSGSGCNVDQLEPLVNAIPIPSDCYDFEGFEKTGIIQGKSDFSGSILAHAKVVPSVDRQNLRDDDFRASSSIAGSKREDSYGTRYPLKESSRISFLRELEVPLVGVRGAKLMSGSLRKSSLDKYDYVWDAFVNFLYVNNCPPIDVNCIAKFLIYLFDIKRLKPNTIASYKCALSLPLKVAFGIDLSVYPFPGLIKGMWNERPSMPIKDPDWSLDKVLEFLSSEKFVNPDFNLLTHKCVFLFALATANRISEVHSYLRGKDNIIFGENLDFVKIVPNAFFLAKNELPSNRRKVFVIKALKVKGKHSPVCPVRCLFMYIKAARSFPSKFLFVNPRTGRHCSKFVLSQFIVRTVKWACPNSFPKSHDVRKLSSTRAFLSRMSMKAIIKRGSWKSGAVFANHYLAKTFLASKRCVAMGSST